MLRTVSVLLIVVALCAPPARAWSNKEHIQLTRIAAMRLINDPATPPEMKQWLRDVMPGIGDMESERHYFLTARVGQYPNGAQGLAFWATVPDLDVATARAGGPEKKVGPFGIAERPMHFIDAEFFNPDESKRVYAHDLSTKPKIGDFPRDPADPRYARAGMLPFRVEQCYAELVKHLKAGRLDAKPGQFPRDEHAAKWAGYLAHYVEDNTQPQHATIDYKSASYFRNKRAAPNVHANMEYTLIDDEHADYMPVRERMWAQFVGALDEVKDPVQKDDLWLATLEVSLTSYDALPLIGQAAVAAYGSAVDPGEFDAEKFAGFEGTYLGREMTLSEMKAHQLAWAVKRVERVWLKAWVEAHPTDE